MKKDRRERLIPAPNTAGAGRAWPGWRQVGLGRLERCSVGSGVGSGARKTMRRAVASTCYEIEAWNAVREGGVGSTRYERGVESSAERGVGEKGKPCGTLYRSLCS
jgi:hypothetical protein